MELVAVFLFAMALSTDGFFVGIAYGLKHIKIPLASQSIIVLLSVFAVTISMLCGRALALILPGNWASAIGAGMLLIIALSYFVRAFKAKLAKADEEKPLLKLTIKSLGIIIQIIKEPSSADLDASGEISTHEACWLGIALAVDSLGAGLGAAMAGLNIELTAISVGVINLIMINCGLGLGRVVKAKRLGESASFILAGIMFLVIGILKLI